MNVSLLHGHFREQMQLFLGNLRAVPKTARRFCLEALYGIVARRSVSLSEIARSLGESIALIKTENRLSRQVSRPGLWERVTRFVIEQSAHRVQDDTLLVIDPSDLAKKHGRCMEHLATVRDGSEQRLELRFGMRRVALPDFPDRPLCLVVLRGFTASPLMILTTQALSDSRASLWWAIEAYLTRWRIEETLRFAKQTYQIEDVRVLSYESLRNMMALVLVAMSFTMLWLGEREKLAILTHHALDAARRFFGIADFRYYALADGLAEILSKRLKPAFGKSRDTNHRQLDLFFSRA